MPNKKNSLTRNIIAQQISENVGISYNHSREIVGDIIETIIDELSKNNDVNIMNFGKFEIRQQKARMGRNLRNGTNHLIPARKKVAFSASQNLKKFLNDNRDSHKKD